MVKKKNKITLAAYGMVAVAILVGSFLATNIVQHAIAQSNPTNPNATSSGTTGGNATSHNATSSGTASGGATAAANKTK